MLELLNDWEGRAVLALSAVAIVVVFAFCALVFQVATLPTPTCPDGYTLAGGGYGGRYHCIPGVEPRR